MINLPKQYQWLNNENEPRMLVEALKLYGTKEVVGEGNNPDILRWAYECGIYDYKADSVPWCGLFIAVVARRADKYVPQNPLWARNWVKWGEAASQPELGDVLVFSRGSGGHVGLYVGEDEETYHVLGGNQGDAVSITRVRKKRLLAARNLYRTGKPSNVRRIFISSTGGISLNET